MVSDISKVVHAVFVGLLLRSVSLVQCHMGVRKDDTPEARAVWAAVEKAASRCPEWLKKRVQSMPFDIPGLKKMIKTKKTSNALLALFQLRFLN